MKTLNDAALELPPAIGTDELRNVTLRIASAIDAAHSTPIEQAARTVVFRVGEATVALPLEHVREIVLPAPLSRAPRTPDVVLGIMNLRGRAVAVVDLRFVLAGCGEGVGLRSLHTRLAQGHVLLLTHGRREMGALVDEVLGIEASGESTRVLAPESLFQSIDALIA